LLPWSGQYPPDPTVTVCEELQALTVVPRVGIHELAEFRESTDQKHRASPELTAPGLESVKEGANCPLCQDPAVGVLEENPELGGYMSWRQYESHSLWFAVVAPVQ